MIHFHAVKRIVPLRADCVYNNVSDSPRFFWGDPAHAHAMFTRPFSLLDPPLKKGPGYEARYVAEGIVYLW